MSLNDSTPENNSTGSILITFDVYDTIKETDPCFYAFLTKTPAKIIPSGANYYLSIIRKPDFTSLLEKIHKSYFLLYEYLIANGNPMSYEYVMLNRKTAKYFLESNKKILESLPKHPYIVEVLSQKTKLNKRLNVTIILHTLTPEEIISLTKKIQDNVCSGINEVKKFCNLLKF